MYTEWSLHQKNFYLWMDLKNPCKIIKVYLCFLFQPNRTKNKEISKKMFKNVSSVTTLN
jgi:hypothetical protein